LNHGGDPQAGFELLLIVERRDPQLVERRADEFEELGGHGLVIGLAVERVRPRDEPSSLGSDRFVRRTDVRGGANRDVRARPEHPGVSDGEPNLQDEEKGGLLLALGGRRA